MLDDNLCPMNEILDDKHSQQTITRDTQPSAARCTQDSWLRQTGKRTAELMSTLVEHAAFDRVNRGSVRDGLNQPCTGGDWNDVIGLQPKWQAL